MLSARGAGVRLSDYARAHGVGIRSIYDSMAALRQKGFLGQGSPRAESAFVAVRVETVAKAEPVPGGVLGSLICRLRVGEVLIECMGLRRSVWIMWR